MLTLQTKKRKPNLILEYLQARKMDIRGWEGWCLELCVSATEWFKNNKIEIKDTLYLKCKLGDLRPRYFKKYDWVYHAVVLDKNDYIHDAWCPYVVTLKEYLDIMFPNQNVIVTTVEKMKTLKE